MSEISKTEILFTSAAQLEEVVKKSEAFGRQQIAAEVYEALKKIPETELTAALKRLRDAVLEVCFHPSKTLGETDAWRKNQD